MSDTPKDQSPVDSSTGNIRDSLVNKMKQSPHGDAGVARESPLAFLDTEAPSVNKKAGFELLKRKHIVAFTDELALLLEMGLTLLRALQIIGRRTASQKMRRVARDLASQVERGGGLAEAMSTHATVFSRYYVKSVQAGEESGNMVTALRILSTYLNREESLANRLRGTMMYPAITTGMAMMVLTFLLVYVVPTFSQVYAELGMELPGPTQALLNISLFFRKMFWLLVLLFLGGVGFLIAQARYQLIEELSTRILLRLPYLKAVIMKIIVYRFARLMGMLTGSGVGLLQSLKLATSTIAIPTIRHSLETVAYGVEQGETFSAGLRQEKIFPDFIVDMIAIGEEAGSLTRVFERMANNLEGEVNSFFETISSILEPMMTLFVGFIVLIIAVALFLPYYSLALAQF